MLALCGRVRRVRVVCVRYATNSTSMLQAKDVSPGAKLNIDSSSPISVDRGKVVTRKELYMPTGGLNHLPDVMSKEAMLVHALAQADKVKVESSIPALRRLNIIKNDRKKSHAKIGRKKYLRLAGRVSTSKSKAAFLKKADILIESFLKQFKRWEGKFPTLLSLHPFERALIELSLPEGKKTYEQTIKNYFLVQRRIENFRERARIELSKVTYTKGVGEWYFQQVRQLKTLLKTKGDGIDELKSMFKRLFKMNALTPLLPTATLIGMPNIGKSSLVRCLSSATPEVQNYAFTTRSIIVGHLLLEGRAKGRNLIQVTDTPGMLSRPDIERNQKELLTVAVLNNFPHITVVFVVDPTRNLGAPLAHQFALRADLKSRFTQHAWVDVVSKCDMEWEKDQVLAMYPEEDREKVLITSAATTEGVDALRTRLKELGESFMEEEHWDALQGQKQYAQDQIKQQEQAGERDDETKAQELSAWLAATPKVKTVDNPKGRKPLNKGESSSVSKKSKASRLWTNDLRRPR